MPTMPLTPEEFANILASSDALNKDHERRFRARGLLLLMRWSGLALGDALKLRRSAIWDDATKGSYRVTTTRQKTGTDVSVHIPPAVELEILSVPNDTWTASANGATLSGHPDYVFCDGKADIVQTFTKTVIAPAFKATRIERKVNMTSHRLPDIVRRGLARKERPDGRGIPVARTHEHPYDREELCGR